MNANSYATTIRLRRWIATFSDADLLRLHHTFIEACLTTTDNDDARLCNRIIEMIRARSRRNAYEARRRQELAL